MTTIINVADLPQPNAITPLSQAAIMARSRAAFVAFWNEVRDANPDLGLPLYSVEMLETDPFTIVDRALSGRELLQVARTNDSVRAVMPAFSTGTDLDNLVARVNVIRLAVAWDDDGNPTAFESDAKLLNRFLAAYAAPAAGSEDCYIYRAATAWPERHDIRPYNYATPGLGLEPGEVAVYLLATGGEDVPDAAVSNVVRALGPETARPMTDVVSVRKTTVRPWTISAKLILPRGASPAAIVAGRRAALQAFADRRYHIAGLVTEAGAISALWEPNVINVTDLVITGLDHGLDKAPYLSGATLTYEVQA